MYFFLSHVLYTIFLRTRKKITSYTEYVRDFRILTTDLLLEFEQVPHNRLSETWKTTIVTPDAGCDTMK